MNANFEITRRAFTGAALALGFAHRPSRAQGFAGLDNSAEGFASVLPGRKFSFPEDLGPHPDFRIEWWYVTANLADAAGNAYGVQWTLFRQALRPGEQQTGWANQQIWMGHAAVTSANLHRFSETFARGGVGQAGVDANPFRAWIDSWEARGLDDMNANTIAPLTLTASGTNFSYALRLDSDRALALQGDAGYSRKSEHEQASYYYSQPFFQVTGHITIDDKPVEVTGQAWMDREWSSQPLAPDQKGWDWFALYLKTGERLMLYRIRKTDGSYYCTGNWISPDSTSEQLSPSAIEMEPTGFTDVGKRRLPTAWHIKIPAHLLSIECGALNPQSWMGTSFPYWEGPIGFNGTHTGVGYLEMTGYSE
jgi:predicted secreted hydrolase